MPLRISFPPQRSLIRLTSSQLRVVSNCSAVQDDSERRSPTPFAWPTMLRNVRRFVPNIPRHQRGLPARLGGEIDDVRNRHPGRGREAVLGVLVTLTEDLEIHR